MDTLNIFCTLFNSANDRKMLHLVTELDLLGQDYIGVKLELEIEAGIGFPDLQGPLNDLLAGLDAYRNITLITQDQWDLMAVESENYSSQLMETLFDTFNLRLGQLTTNINAGFVGGADILLSSNESLILANHVGDMHNIFKVNKANNLCANSTIFEELDSLIPKTEDWAKDLNGDNFFGKLQARQLIYGDRASGEKNSIQNELNLLKKLLQSKINKMKS